MLVLSRKQGEQLRIGDDITISVLEVRGHRVRLGIQAPGSTRIMRAELCEWHDEPEHSEEHHAVALAN